MIIKYRINKNKKHKTRILIKKDNCKNNEKLESKTNIDNKSITSIIIIKESGSNNNNKAE